MGSGLRLSPSGKQIAFVEGNPPDVFVYDLERRVKTRLTTSPETDHNPVWSPDGSRVVFDSHRQGPDPQSASDAGLYERPSNGATAEQPMLDREKGVQHSPRDWSADGNTLVFAKQGQNGRWNLWGLPLTGDHKPFPYRNSELQRKRSGVVPERTVSCLSAQTSRAGTKSSFSHSPTPARPVADFQRRRFRSAMASRWPRVVLHRSERTYCRSVCHHHSPDVSAFNRRADDADTVAGTPCRLRAPRRRTTSRRTDNAFLPHVPISGVAATPIQRARQLVGAGGIAALDPALTRRRGRC
jgi:dipeptidyl aminopeptidase/acylaminoacyl peptidase